MHPLLENAGSSAMTVLTRPGLPGNAGPAGSSATAVLLGRCRDCVYLYGCRSIICALCVAQNSASSFAFQCLTSPCVFFTLLSSSLASLLEPSLYDHTACDPAAGINDCAQCPGTCDTATCSHLINAPSEERKRLRLHGRDCVITYAWPPLRLPLRPGERRVLRSVLSSSGPRPRLRSTCRSALRN